MENDKFEVATYPFGLDEKNAARTLLKALWGDLRGTRFVVAMRAGGDAPCRQMAVCTVDEGLAEIERWAESGMDCYFSVAEYENADDRKAANVKCIRAFFVDIDCGADKASEFKGYADIEEARRQLNEFCAETTLPKPNYLVNSGGGLHAYWVLSEALNPDKWQAAARKLKDVMKAVSFRADPSRTCDRASILRVPGTWNYKYTPPKSVQLEKANTSPISALQMLDAIEEAHGLFCAKPVAEESAERDFGKPDVEVLKAALSHLDPDCDEGIWKFRRIAPLARAAMAHPEMAEELQQLAKDWSSGELCGTSSRAWITPGATSGKTGEAEFPQVWDRFVNERTPSTVNTLGSLFHDAGEAGWKVPAKGGANVKPTERSKESLKQEARLAVLAAVEKYKAGDHGAPYESNALEAFATLAKLDAAELQRMKALLKAANSKFSMGDLDKAIRNHSKAEKTIAPTHHGYATDTLKRLEVDGHPAVAYQGDLYVLNEKTKMWVVHPDAKIERDITKHHDDKKNCQKRVDYESIRKQIYAIAEDSTFFDEAAEGIASGDFFYSVQGDQINVEQLKPEHRQRVKLDFPIKEEPTPLFDKFLHETFMSQVAGEEIQQRNLMQEIFGATMLGLMHKQHKAVLWYDAFGRAGKGTMQNILENLVPKPFITAVSPVDWDDEYYLANLAGKRFNVVGELPQDQFIPAADFKGIIGGDLKSGRNPAGRPITFKNTASHIFMSNHMINTKDHSEAFYTRWIMVGFENSRLKHGLPLDPQLADSMTAEIGAIAHWALLGAKRLQAQGKFSASIVHDRLMSQWRRSSNALEEFIHDECDLDSKALVRRSDFYKRFKEWCDENGRKAFAKGRVKELLEHNIKLGIRHASLDGHEVFRGVQFKKKSPPVESKALRQMQENVDAQLHPGF